MLNTLTDMRRLGVDRNSTLQDQRFHLQSRAESGLGQNLVQLGRIRFGQQHALKRRHFGTVLVGIELA